ncbi:MAG: phosphoglycolate phosphatase [Paracoccaceae bacterium]|jgi:phosphoglycolate phosphatase
MTKGADMTFGTVVFDLDGTLADTSKDLIASANYCFRALGHDDLLDPLADGPLGYQGGRTMLRVGFQRVMEPNGVTETLIDEQYSILLKAYDQAIDVHTKLYPKVAEAIQNLRYRGFKTAICTNKPEDLARKLVRSLGVIDLFDALIGADTLSTRKPDPAPYFAAVRDAGGVVAQSFLVGDTKTDHDTARACNVASVLVGFGPEGLGLSRLEPDALLMHYDELPDLTDRLLSSQKLR